MINRLFRNQASKPLTRSRGIIGAHGLSTWWVSYFSEEERQYIEQTYKPFSLPPVERPLTKGSGNMGTMGIALILSGVATFFRKPEDYRIACKILNKAEELGGKDILGLHFTYQGMIETHYRMRSKDPSALANAIEACRRQIELAPKTAAIFTNDSFTTSLPMHKGYQQLAIILYKQNAFEEAIALCKQAKEQSWAGDWDNRINRYQSRLEKQKS